MYDAYRQRAQELGWTAGPDRFAYAVCIGVGHTRAEGLRRADLIAGYVRTAGVVAEPFTNPPGYNSLGANVAMLKAGPGKGGFVRDRAGHLIDATKASVEQFIETDTVFAGTPDDVVRQITDFNQRMGGVGHLLFFGQGGFLDHKDTADNIRLFAREVFPRIQHLNADRPASTGRPVAAE
jgi:alkanesulfonate monooxygenase SsuD/methylene tetrahydromethanopterin reductase-like flavin-dependent oxidoreductase (luciferase family)